MPTTLATLLRTYETANNTTITTRMMGDRSMYVEELRWHNTYWIVALGSATCKLTFGVDVATTWQCTTTSAPSLSSRTRTHNHVIVGFTAIFQAWVEIRIGNHVPTAPYSIFGIIHPKHDCYTRTGTIVQWMQSGKRGVNFTHNLFEFFLLLAKNACT